MRVINGAELRKLRQRSGMSTMDVASGSGINQTSVYKYESGEHRVRDATAYRLAEALDYPVHYFSMPLQDVKCDAVKFAERKGFSRIRAYQYLNEGRVAGAYKDENDNWRVPEDATIQDKPKEVERV